jgi:hypothetical protein
MAVHDYHQVLPGYSEAQILHDGCGECETRGKSINLAIGSMDKGRFAKAWKRAADWNTNTDVLDVSRAERPLLEALWAIQIRLEMRGIPIGQVPGGAVEELGMGDDEFYDPRPPELQPGGALHESEPKPAGWLMSEAFARLGVFAPGQRLEEISTIVGRQAGSSMELTPMEVGMVLEALQNREVPGG